MSLPILVVEDREVDRLGMEAVLRGRGYNVLVASDGKEALEVAINNHPGLILLDMLMPRVDGWDFLKIRKQDPALRGIPVIVVTGVSIASDEWARAAGASGCLKKPVDVEELIAKIELSLPA
jgi:CheY-like chemotaxis protein